MSPFFPVIVGISFEYSTIAGRISGFFPKARLNSGESVNTGTNSFPCPSFASGIRSCSPSFRVYFPCSSGAVPSGVITGTRSRDTRSAV